MKKIILYALLVFGITCISVYYPLSKKGYAPWSDYLTLIQARNGAANGSLAYESPTGVFLSTETARTAAIQTAVPNALTVLIYKHLFKWFGFSFRLPIYLTIVLFGLFNV